jgi:aromatic-L-amino-acid/L-tryptophan decarboxylase
MPRAPHRPNPDPAAIDVNEPTPSTPPGDMPPEEFRRHAHAVAEWITAYLQGVEQYPVLAQVRPGEVAAQLPASPPEHGEEFDAILADFDRVILPGITHWNHPDFFAYFAISGSGPGILGEALAAALNTNAMLWRTGPAQTELEARTLDWLRQLMGLPEGFHGTIHDTASISTLVALATARDALGLRIREQGMSGRDLPRLRVYCSEQVHSSIDKAAITLGLGIDGVRKIATDNHFRMLPSVLHDAIRDDVEDGVRPMAVVATVGTTSTSSIDPVAPIADLCARHGVWLHVDAAYGGSAAVVPELRWIMEGVERADSLVVNPHKWLFTPVDLSALYFRRPELARRAFSLVPDYLVTPEGESVTNLMDYGPALGKRFRSLKLWMVLRYFGAEGLAARIREHVRLAGLFARWVHHDPEWVLMAPTPLSLVVFRFAPEHLSDEDADAANERIMTSVNASGRMFLSHTKLRGRTCLRFAIGNIRTTESHVRRAWELLKEAAAVEVTNG